MEGLSDRFHIAPSVAELYRPRIQELREAIHGNRGLIDGMEWLDEAEVQSRQEIPEIVDLAPELPLNAFVESVCRASRRERIRIHLQTAFGSTLDLDQLAQDFSVRTFRLDRTTVGSLQPRAERSSAVRFGCRPGCSNLCPAFAAGGNPCHNQYEGGTKRGGA